MNASIQLMKKYEAITVFYFEFSGALFFSLKANPTPLMLSRSRLYIHNNMATYKITGMSFTSFKFKESSRN